MEQNTNSNNFDYGNFIDAKTKKRLLADSIEELNNSIKYYIDEKSPEEVVAVLEKLQCILDTFVRENISNKGENYNEEK